MVAVVVFRILGKGAKRVYILTPKEWKKIVPYSKLTMFKKYEKWQKRLRGEV
jgi:hypothetical protein